MSLYTLEALRFAFAEQMVLDIPNLTIAEGQITALTGPNGSGKTTLLMLLGALLWPSSGRILYRGRTLPTSEGREADTIRREIGFVMQSPYLFRASVARNVGYGLAVRGVSKKDRLHHVHEALQGVGLEGFETRPHHALSGGEIQRVALARALVTAPRTLLLDEPLANVDAGSRAIIERVLINESRQHGLSVLFTTHDLDQAHRIADDVLTLNAGSVIEGPMENIYHGAIYRDGANCFFQTAQLTIAIPPGYESCRTVAISPEAIRIGIEKENTNAHNVFRGRIIAMRDRDIGVEVTVDAGETFMVRITGDAYRSMDLRLGQEVSLAFQAEAVRLS
ncbi:ABC transporter ATP-binding protein [Candidatus Entotheonella palauensis]|uniref:ABC transporter ATP-binding protein n=1 Tax=Candidatus Entotheonella palauensis TaxID=93172 RepID=UPI000B7CC15C|nr:ABC transporter ATP-binding protein [Candidatus Entotheonella palauensis]